MIISKASNLNNTSFGKIEAPVKQYLVERDILARKENMIEKIIPIVKTKKFADGYSGQTSLGGFKPGGEAGTYPENYFQDGYNKIIENSVEWKNSFAITLQMIEDGHSYAWKDKSRKFLDSYYNTKCEYVGKFLTSAIATTMTFEGKTFNIAGGDGKALFATDHPSVTGGTDDQSNLYDAAFTKDNLTKLELILANQKEDNGKKLSITPDTIIQPYSTTNDALQLQKIFEVLTADGDPTTANRAGVYHTGRWNLIWWAFLGTPTGMTAGYSPFYLADMKYVMNNKPYVLQERIPLTISSYVDDNTDNNIWKGRSREVASPTNDFRGILLAAKGLGSSL
jgi:hypothetical protein